MRYRLLVLSFAVLAWAVPAAPLGAQFKPNHPWLVLDVGGHTAPVSRALFTPDGKELITVSKDKTIRFWKVSTGEMLRVLRPPIGPGREGELYAAALSPDGKYLAVAGFGFHHATKAQKRPSDIYVIDLAAEEVYKHLKGHNSRVEALAFSRDGKHLASGAGDKLIRVWDVHGDKEPTVLKGHAGSITSLAFSPDGKRLLSADNTDAAEAWLWSLDKGQVVAKLAGRHKSPVTQVAWGGANGNRLATGGDGENFVAVWDGDGKHVKNLDYTDRPMTCQSLAFTPDGKSVVVSGKDEWKSNVCKIDLAGGKALRYVDGKNWFEDPNVAAGPAAVSPDGKLVAVAGDRSHQVHVYDAHKAAWLGECGAPLLPASAVAWAKDADADGRTVVWRTRLLPKNRDPGKPPAGAFFDRAFQLKVGDFRPVLVPHGKDAAFEHNRWSAAGMHLEQEGGGSLRLVNGKKKTDAVMEARMGWIVPEAVSFVGPDRAVFATTDGNMDVYEISKDKDKVTLLGGLGGFNGAINSVAPSPDGRHYLLASGEDNVLYVWDPHRAQKDDPAKEHVHHGRLLSLFVAPPPGAGPKAKLAADWVAWTPEGYYAASPGGERLMGWHLNNGDGKLATFHPASRFRAKFFRPDVIERVLQAGSVEEALKAAAKAGAKDAAAVDVAQVLPPDVDVTISPPKDGKVTITAKARPVNKDSKESISSLQLLIDERPWTDKDGTEALKTFAKPPYEASWTVALPPGEHRIRVLARTASSLGSSRGLVRELAPPPAKKDLPALYVLAIGIDKYPGRLALKGAVNDATELEKTLRENHSKSVFSKYDAKVLPNEKATKQGILDGIAWLKERQTAADVAVIYYAGHGALANKEFYLVPQDADFNTLPTKGLSRAEIKKQMQALPGRILVVLDACHSGAIGLLFDDVSRELTDEDCGVAVMCAAGPRQAAQEKEHGFLTLSVIEGLQGKAPMKDKYVYLHHLPGYVIDRVGELSKDTQHPNTVVPPWWRPLGLSEPPAPGKPGPSKP